MWVVSLKSHPSLIDAAVLCASCLSLKSLCQGIGWQKTMEVDVHQLGMWSILCRAPQTTHLSLRLVFLGVFCNRDAGGKILPGSSFLETSSGLSAPLRAVGMG